MGLKINGKVRFGGVPSVLDGDASLFISAAGITDATQKSAINTLVLGLKSNNIWSKMKAIYPFVGGTASSHKFNLKDPRDANDAFRLTFNGGWSHSSTGAVANGTTGYADTYFIPSVNLSQFNLGASYYSRTGPYSGVVGDQHFFGAVPGSGSGYFMVDWYFSGNMLYVGLNDNFVFDFAYSQSQGLFSFNRTANNLAKIYRNGNSIATSTTVTNTTLPTINLYLAASNINPTPRKMSRYECAFFAIHDGLNDTDSSNLSNIINIYQTTLNRQI